MSYPQEAAEYQEKELRQDFYRAKTPKTQRKTCPPRTWRALRLGASFVRFILT